MEGRKDETAAGKEEEMNAGERRHWFVGGSGIADTVE